MANRRLANGPFNFKLDLQMLTVQFTLEAELAAAALTMKGAVFCSNMIQQRAIYLVSTLLVAGNRTYSLWTKHIALRYLFVQDLVEDKITIHYVKSQDPLTDLSSKHLGKHRHHALIKYMNNVQA